jgi:hypothetical protein
VVGEKAETHAADGDVSDQRHEQHAVRKGEILAGELLEGRCQLCVRSPVGRGSG